MRQLFPQSWLFNLKLSCSKRGLYALKEVTGKAVQAQLVNAKSADETEGAGAVQAFGMFWRRDSVFWSGKPQLLGKQGVGATDVNFANQIGVYRYSIEVAGVVETPFRFL